MTTTPAAKTDVEGGAWEAGGASGPQARCAGVEPRPASGDAAWLVADSTSATRAGGTQDVWNRFGPPTAGPQRSKYLRRWPNEDLSSTQAHRHEEKDRDDWSRDRADRLDENAPRAWKEQRQSDQRQDDMMPRHEQLSSEWVVRNPRRSELATYTLLRRRMSVNSARQVPAQGRSVSESCCRSCEAPPPNPAHGKRR